MDLVLQGDVKFTNKIHDQWNAIDYKNENGFICLNEDWTVIYLNRTAEVIFGKNAADTLQKNFWVVFRDVIPVLIFERYSKQPPEKMPGFFTQYWPEMGGWVVVNTYFENASLSISFRLNKLNEMNQLPEIKLFVMNELYKFVTEITNNCLWDWNIVTEEIFWIDGGHKRLFGYDIENCLLPQIVWVNRIHPEDKVNLIAQLYKVIEANNQLTLDYEYRFRKANGEYAHVHDRARIIRDDNNKPYRIIGTTNDITEKKLAEIKLAAAENKLSMIVEQTINGIIITDSKDEVIYVNKAFTDITGFSEGEVTGKKPGSFLQGKDTDPATVQYIRKMMNNKRPFDCEILNYRKSGQEVWIHMQGQSFCETDGTDARYFAMQTDITESILSRQEQRLEYISNQNEIAEAVLTALEKERNLIAREIHDNINHTLVASKLYIEMAMSEGANSVSYLKKSSGFIAQVIEDIRKISKGLISSQLLGFFHSIQAVIDDIMMVHPIEITFSTKKTEENDLDEKIKLNLFRIIQEQLTNILKHSNASKAKIAIQTIDDNVVLTISDNGKGCDTTIKRKGVGIRNINTRAGIFQGSVKVVSRVGKGFRLQVSLSLNSAANSASSASSASSAMTALQ